MLPIVVLYVACVVYSVVRYVAFAPANVANLPVLIFNKGISMAAALCFATAFWMQRRSRNAPDLRSRSNNWFRAGVFGVFAHIPLSLSILERSYFPEFFDAETGRMTMMGEFVFLFGALTTGALYLVTRHEWTRGQRWGISLATMSLLFVHTLFMGISRGLNINAKHGYLPPMWFLSLIGIAAGLAFVLMGRPRQDDSSV